MATLEARGGLSLRALVAEDNAVNQMLVTRLLEFRGFVVAVVENGRKAVDRLEEESFDIVLMDLQMPEMSGIEATAAIRDRELFTGRRRTPIIAVTANDEAKQRRACLEAGMDDFVAKPITPSVLFQAISLLVGERS